MLTCYTSTGVTVPHVSQSHGQKATIGCFGHLKAAVQRSLQLPKHPHSAGRFELWPVHTALVTTPALPTTK